MKYLFLDATYPNRGPEKFLCDLLSSEIFNHNNTFLITSKPNLVQKIKSFFKGKTYLNISNDSKFKDIDVYVCNNLGSYFKFYKYINNKPTIIIFHNEYVDWRNRLKLFFLYFKKNVVLFAVSSYSRGLLYSNKYYSRYSISLLPNFIVGQIYTKNIDSIFSSSDINICYVGSCYPKKGFDVFYKIVSILRENPRLKFHVIGFGEKDIQIGLDLCGIKNDPKTNVKIYFHGRVEDVQSKLRTMDILLATSPLESFGRSILEAIQNDLLVICSDNPGYMSTLTPDIHCYSFPVGNANYASKVVLQAINNKEASREKILNARKLLGYYNQSSIAKSFKERIDLLVSGSFPEKRWNSGDKVVTKS